MVRIYCRCNDGHYFVGGDCPLDGWSTYSLEVDRGVRALHLQGTALSIAALRSTGVSEEAIRRCIVVEFGDEASAFEAVAPHGYFVDGVWVEWRDFDPRRFL